MRLESVVNSDFYKPPEKPVYRPFLAGSEPPLRYAIENRTRIYIDAINYIDAISLLAGIASLMQLTILTQLAMLKPDTLLTTAINIGEAVQSVNLD